MALYDGHVNLSDNEIPVIVELGEDSVRLSADGSEVGEWSLDECDITRSSETTFLIHAEAEELPFVPKQPGAFAGAVGLASEKAAVPLPPADIFNATPVGHTIEAPPPQPLTMGLFYALCLVTAATAVWALVAMAL